MLRYPWPILVLSLALSGCMPCLATPDCLGHHTIRVVDQNDTPITPVTYDFATEQGEAENWVCPSDDARCRGDGSVSIFGDGQLIMTTDDGRSAEVTLVSGKTPECGCGALVDETVRIP